MPENPSQYQKQEDAVASIQKQLNEEGKRETNEDDVFTLGESAKLKKLKANEKIKDRKPEVSTNGESAKLTVESKGGTNGQMHAGEKVTEDNSSTEIAQNGTADHTGEGAPIAPYSEDQKENQKAATEDLNTESNSEDSGDLESSVEDDVVSEEVETQVSSENTDQKQKEENITEKELLSNREAIISKIISAGDPVLLNGVKDFDTPGAWFYTGENEIITDRSGKGTDQKSQVKIIFKQPGGQVTDERQVTWSEVTPQYDSAEEYTQALRTILEKYKQAEERENHAYEKHLKSLLWQTAYFAQKFNIREKKKLYEELKNQVEKT